MRTDEIDIGGEFFRLAGGVALTNCLLYLQSMTGRIGTKGQVVIPKALRDRARLQPGDEVEFEMRDEEIVLFARPAPARLGARFKRTGMAARLLEDRAREPR
jgi:antitoxin PrlF